MKKNAQTVLMWSKFEILIIESFDIYAQMNAHQIWPMTNELIGPNGFKRRASNFTKVFF